MGVNPLKTADWRSKIGDKKFRSGFPSFGNDTKIDLYVDEFPVRK